MCVLSILNFSPQNCQTSFMPVLYGIYPEKEISGLMQSHITQGDKTTQMTSWHILNTC